MTNNTVKALFIDPFKRDIKLVDLEIDEENELVLKELYKFLDCELVEVVHLEGNRILIVDEEGLLKTDLRFFSLNDEIAKSGSNQGYYAGKALIVDYINSEPVDFKGMTCNYITFTDPDKVAQPTTYLELQKGTFFQLKEQFMNEVKDTRDTLSRLLDWVADVDVSEAISFMNDTIEYHNK